MTSEGSEVVSEGSVAGAPLDEATEEQDSSLASHSLRELQRDLYTLSAVCRRVLEQNPLEATPNAPVTVDQLRVLRYVTRNPGLRVGEVAARLGMKPPSASSALDRLEAKKLVVRRGGREDQRTVYIKPTAAGTALVRQVQERVEAKLSQSVGRLEGEEMAALPGLIRKLVAAMMVDEEIFADLCHHCGPGYNNECPVHRLFGSCPYAEENQRD